MTRTIGEIIDWLDDLASRVTDDDDRRALAEAMVCARAGAKRAAFVMSWIGAAESIRRRLAVLSRTDAEAGHLLKEIEKAETERYAVDQRLLDAAHRVGMISAPEKVRLEQVLSSRHIYAHPTNEAPSEPVLAAAMTEVVDIVLARPVYLRHRYIRDTVDAILTRIAFMDDDRPIVRSRANSIFNRIDPTLHSYFMSVLVQKAEDVRQDETTEQTWVSRRVGWFLYAYGERLDESAVTALPAGQLLAECPAAASELLALPSIIAHLSEEDRDTVVGEICQRAPRSAVHLARLVELRAHGIATERERERFQQTLNASTVPHLARSEVPFAEIAPRIVERLKVYSWYSQNPAAEVLLRAGPDSVRELDPAVQEALGRNVLQAADGASRGAHAVLTAAAGRPWPSAFVTGLLLECFVNEAQSFRLKTSRYPDTIKALDQLERGTLIQVLGDVATAIAASYWLGPPDEEATRAAASVLLERFGDDADSLIDALTSVRELPF
ncbi:MAG: hypothetical protein GEU80_02945 [Dehalococcoidia bacterium]|nr:hypothetical protein [Dehalococcoidia bacterium]